MIGSGVTGVEFVHMFSSFGSEVTLIVSRQQVLPTKDPEVAAALEDDFLRRGVRLLKGARATRIEHADDGVRRPRATTAGVAEGSHALLAIGSIPNSEDLGLDSRRASRSTAAATSRSTTTASRTCRTSTPPATCRGSCRCRRWRRCRAARSPST